MKVKELIVKLHQSILSRDKQLEKKYWLALLKKSLKHKKTHAVR
jgi:hypothetical protein